jgi:hypothetical protein
VLFGSNHPAWPAADCLQDLPSLGLDDQAADLFLCCRTLRMSVGASLPVSVCMM